MGPTFQGFHCMSDTQGQLGDETIILLMATVLPQRCMTNKLCCSKIGHKKLSRDNIQHLQRI